MESFLVLTLLIFVGGAVCGIVAVLQLGGLRREVDALRRDVLALKRRPPSETATPRPVAATAKAAARQPSNTDPEAGAAEMPSPAPKSDPKPKPEPRPAVPATPRPLPPRAPKPPRKPLDLETLLGAKGSVWIGGLALLFGAVFLLRYTIEAGLLSPPYRVGLAIVLGLLSLGASEWLARRDLSHPAAKALSERADIPALLAGIGSFTLFGAAYAAHALYGLIGTMPAFLAMGAVALGTMLMSLRRGDTFAAKVLAAIGLVGALVVPLLVASVTPSIIGLHAYIALITAAALWLAQHRDWGWLKAAALAGATVWLTMPLAESVDVINFALSVAGLLAVTVLTVPSLFRAPALPTRNPWALFGWLGFAVLCGLWNEAGTHWMPISYVLPFLFVLAIAALCTKGEADRRWPALLIAAVSFVLVFADESLPDWMTAVPVWAPLAAVMTAALGLATFHVASRVTSGRTATGMTVLNGIALLFLVTAKGRGFNQIDGVEAALFVFSLSGFFAVASLMQTRTAVIRAVTGLFALCWIVGIVWLGERQGDFPLAAASLLASAGFAVALALVMRRSDPLTRLLSIVPGLFAGLIATMAIEDSAREISLTPWLNELWLYFGIPGAVAALGAVALARFGSVQPKALAVPLLRGGACVFAGLLSVFLIHHAMNGGDLSADVGFEDLAAQLLVAFGLMTAAGWSRSRLLDWPEGGAPQTFSDLGPFILPGLAVGLSLLSLSAFGVYQLGAFNPLFEPGTQIDGHPVFNALLMGYLAPAVLLGLTALRAAGRRPVWYVRVLGALAGLSWLAWTVTQIRRLAQGPLIDMDLVPWDNVELYAVSAVWLLTGLALLGAGAVTKRRDLRVASAALVTLTTLKVFLVDMSALDGALRARSFIGLGGALSGIGRLYQRVLVSPDRQPADGEDGREGGSP